jgi:hypothetical protein
LLRPIGGGVPYRLGMCLLVVLQGNGSLANRIKELWDLVRRQTVRRFLIIQRSHRTKKKNEEYEGLERLECTTSRVDEREGQLWEDHVQSVSWRRGSQESTNSLSK